MQDAESHGGKPQQPGDVLVYESVGCFAEKSTVPRWMQDALTDVFSFVTAHYFVWSWPFLVLFYVLHQRGLDYVSAAMVALYLPSFFSGAQKTGKGKEWEALRTSSVWGLMNKFLRIKIIREQELDPTKKYIFGFHPHGILVLSRIAVSGRNFVDVFPGIKTRLLGASAMYYVPLGRELCLWMGGVDASRSTGEKVLEEGSSIIVYPGGVPEIFKTDPISRVTELVLKKRLGFIKLAMNNGADLVPTFVFGENMWNPPKSVINFFRKTLGIPVLVFWGKFWWMPKAPAKGKRYGLVYGKPISTKHTNNPTDDEVRAIHEEYVAEIERIFKQYKSEFGYDEDETLAIV
ncbi:Diacylglycerol O-acyltransferase [Phytophthora cinnamomi]|uniref:Diacylglycerol O-acyltransferase n=1 Tax=Phytophthora cinnamomi TaxID=4785 RepID=UPI00355A2674|nr:Diacylglycerol O-acyltransferase [Phytophthora cinnamomi]